MSMEGNDTQTAEELVDTLTVEGGTLSEAHLSALTSNDIEQLAQLSQELQLSTQMDSTGTESLVEEEEMQEDVVGSDIGAHEVEIETELPHSPEEILPDIKVRTAIPPLRPLNIAPKPTKVPIAIKSSTGQLLLVQGSGSGQQLKLVSQGQGLSVANLAMGKPITLRPAGKNISTSNMSVLQSKPVFMKKLIHSPKTSADGKSIIITEKVENSGKTSQGSIVLPSPAKTITLAQAQQIGLLTGAKLVPQVATKQAIMVNKAQNKAIKILPQGKTQTKILPAPQTSTAKVGQRILLKQTTANSLVTPGQIIQVAGNAPILAGQLHQINIPGKGVQYIKIVAPASTNSGITTSGTSIAPKQTTASVVETKLSVLPAVTSNQQAKMTSLILTEAVGTAIAPKPQKAISLSRSGAIHVPSSGQIVMLPSGYLSQNAKVAIPAKIAPAKPLVNDSVSNVVENTINLESNGMRPRKPCNCTKSQCLKLYCDCFANGEFCYLCNCMNCFNNLENEEHRQRAIKSCLERNPNAFRPKIGKAKDIMGDIAVRKHTKGCNCKRSGCLKNYCECYEAKIACSSNCKCLGCRNVEDSLDKKAITNQIDADSPIPSSPPLISKLGISKTFMQFRPRRHSTNRHAFNFITDDVIEATSQCLLAISDSAEDNSQDDEVTKRQIIEEFGRCLMEIIECSVNRNANANANANTNTNANTNNTSVN